MVVRLVPGDITRVKIRPALVADIATISDCAASAYTKYIKRIGKPPAPMVADFETLVKSGKIVVAICDEQLAGYVMYYTLQPAMHLENVAVYPAFTGKGIGKLLISHVESKAADLGCEYVELYTNAAMTENLSMYPAMGYEEYDRRMENGFDRVYFRIRVAKNI